MSRPNHLLVNHKTAEKLFYAAHPFVLILQSMVAALDLFDSLNFMEEQVG